MTREEFVQLATAMLDQGPASEVPMRLWNAAMEHAAKKSMVALAQDYVVVPEHIAAAIRAEKVS